MAVQAAVFCFFVSSVLVLPTNLNGDTIYGEEEGLHPVFIFGAMKRGEPLHHWLENPENGYCQFITEAKTVQKLPMVIATEYNVPIVLYRPDIGFNIHGELYEMNLRMIKKLDRYEYLPNEIIARIETITYTDKKNNKTINRPAVMYVKYYVVDDEWMRMPFIADYHSKGDHGQEFKERPIEEKKKKKKKEKKKKKRKLDKEEGKRKKGNSTEETRNGTKAEGKKKWYEDTEGDIKRKIRRMERSEKKRKAKQEKEDLKKSKDSTTSNLNKTEIL